MLAAAIPQAHSFQPNNWWVFEKYDGVRAIWHAADRVLYSKWGNPIALPMYIMDSFPSCSWLDGELWFGYSKDNRKVAIRAASVSTIHSVDWSTLLFMLFDAPNPKLLNKTYEHRYAYLSSVVPKDHPFVKLATYKRCEGGRPQVEEIFKEVCEASGEGIIIRDPKALYLQGYSRHIYKYKVDPLRFICKVPKAQIMHNKGSPYEATPSDSFFELEIEVDQDTFVGDLDSIQEGKFVSFKYLGEFGSGGPPLNPKIYCVRNDILNWEQILHGKTKKPVISRIWSPIVSTKGRWATPQSRRKFFDEFAQAKQFDPLDVRGWYGVTVEEVSQKGGVGLLSHHYGRSLARALLDVYPELDWKPYRFKNVPNKYWHDKERRVDFFNTFAKENSFDPLVPSNWYLISKSKILEEKGATTLLDYYKNSFSSALLDCFPFIGLDPDSMTESEKTTWNNKTRKQFYDAYAKQESFDPKVASNWYSVSRADLIKKGGKFLLNASLQNTLREAYPDIGLDVHQFDSTPHNYWTVEENRKLFFDTFATKSGFDPLVPSNWYSITTDKLPSKKARGVLEHYGRSLIKALLSIYPDIGLHQELFEKRKAGS